MSISSQYAQHYNFKGISVEQGLRRSGAYSLLQDSKGFLWITLDGGGVARFDGKNFKNFDLAEGLPSRKVRAIYEDSNNNLWFGTTEGLCLYKNNKIKVYTTLDGLASKYIRSITEDDNGQIIVGTNDGVSILTDSTFRSIPYYNDSLFDEKIRTFYRDKNFKIWIGSKNGLYYIENNKIKKSKISPSLPNQNILSMEEDSKGNFWIGTENGVLKYNTDTSIVFNQASGLISNRIRAICEDQSGNIWIGTRTGVSCLTKDNIININNENGLTHERIRDILLDNNGTLWFATYYGGINNFNPKDFVTYTTKENLISNQTLCFSQSKLNNRIISGTFDGVSTFEINKGIISNVNNYTELDGLPNNRTFTIFEDSRNYQWIGTKKGIVITSNFNYFQLITNDLNDLQHEIYSIIQEDENTYWVGGEDGLFQVTFSSFPQHYIILAYNSAEIPSTDISSLVKDRSGNIWIGYRNGGIRIKKKNGGIVTPVFSKEIQNISTIVVKENKIWIGTDSKGLFLVEQDNINDSIIKAIQYSTKNQLSSNSIYAIEIDKNNHLWLGSEKGIDHLHLKTNNQIYNIEHFDKNEGLNGGEILEKSIFITNKNDLLIGTVKGLACSSPIKYTHNKQSPIINLLKFETFSKNKDQIQNHINSLDNIVLEYATNNISLDFIGIDLNSPDKIKYKWFLKGYSNQWSSPTKRNFLNFTNLPDKTYELKIISAGKDDIWNPIPLMVEFKIKTPFWKSLLFILAMLFLFALVIFLIVKWKINQLIKKQRILEVKVKEATKTIEEEKVRIEKQSLQIFDQKELLQEQHDEIKQSIDYAQLIQEASLPEMKITDLLSDSFLLYKPRDTVSGDFYWWEKKDDFVLFCVADSTGHGIPGAFISLIGTILSNEIFYSKKLLYPNQILDELNKTIQLTLEQHLPNPRIKDGMDLSFCCYNKTSKKIYFSGANNPIWIVRHNNKELTSNGLVLAPIYYNEDNSTPLYEVKGDKQPVGLHAVKQHPFTLHEIQMNEGDEIYIFTDGYADQFGGERNKKFMSKRFKQLLTSHQALPMQEIRQLIDLNFTNWKGKNAQVDDVCVVGVRI